MCFGSAGCMGCRLRSCATATTWQFDRHSYAQEDPATDDEGGYGSERGSQQRAASSDGGVRSAVTANPESAGGSAAGAAGAPADANGTDQLYTMCMFALSAPRNSIRHAQCILGMPHTHVQTLSCIFWCLSSHGVQSCIATHCFCAFAPEREAGVK